MSEQAASAQGVGGFIHLRVRSAYSLLEGALPLKSLPKLCAANRMPALGVADANNLFGALEFSEAMAGAGLQPIIGVQLALDYAPAAAPGEKSAAPAPILLYAQNEAGYLNLMRLSSRAFLDSDPSAAARIDWPLLESAAEGVICLTGGPNGPAGAWLKAGKTAKAKELLERLARLFPDRLYVELHRHGVDGALRTAAEQATEPGFIDLAYDLDLPLVAVNEVFFPTRDMYEAHDAMLCIGEGRYVSESDRRTLTEEHYFKSPAEMAERFADLPEAIANTVEIARRCAYRPLPRDPILPRFAEDEVAELRRQAQEGLQMRLETTEPVASAEEYQKRLDYELGVIEGMGFPGYFLIVADFIKWAKARGIPVGPGRGSGAGSLVAYALTITNLDPLRYQLLFERFLNPERVSMPDFDIDFCQDRREEVIRYVQEKYGRDKVAQIITFGALLSKVAVRDVGRVLQLSYGQVDRLAKLIPMDGVKPFSVKQALEEEPRLAEAAREEEVVGRLLEIAQKIEGLFRNASTHAAGVVIGDRPLEQLTPLYQDPRSDMPATQFNMKWVERAGLVKFDFLGLKTLTVIKNALDILRGQGIDIDIDAIDLEDAATYRLYSRADTVAVFQVESSGMRDALRQLQPTCIEDIIALVALYRPGPMENIPKYCHVKHGREDADYLHPMLEPILKETQGIIVYQEQVMQIAQVMAGYSLGGADLLRRAMGKKIKEAMDAERPKFLEGSAKNAVPEKKAREVWDLLEKFANYGFNKSHAAAYALVSYQTAWLKANHPVAFMAAAMNLDMQNTDKLSVYRQELDRMAIELAPPDINLSDDMFSVEPLPEAAPTPEDEGESEKETPPAIGRIRYALGALKNVGREAMRRIVAERRENGAYRDLFDFATRVDLRLIGKRALENLARAGAFDSIEASRRRIFESVDTLVSFSGVSIDERASNQSSLFGEAGVETPPPKLYDGLDWASTEKLAGEAAAVGFYISGHPLDEYAGALEKKRILTYAQLAANCGSERTARIAGMVLGRQERKSQKGNSFAFVQLSDPTAQFEAVVFSETLHASRELLETGKGVVLHVTANKEGDGVKLRVEGVQAIDDAVADAATAGLKVYVSEVEALGLIKSTLESLPESERPKARATAAGAAPRGCGPVSLLLGPLSTPELEAELALEGFYPVNPKIRGALKALPGVSHVEEY